MRRARPFSACLFLAVAAACSISDGGAGAETGEEWTPTVMLGDACSDHLECVTGRCEFGVCRMPCQNMSTCVSDSQKAGYLSQCLEEGLLPAGECEARLENMNSRLHTCLWEGELDPTAFHKGGCTLRTERNCDAGSCPGVTVCDPNGMCRMPCETAEDCIATPTAACLAGLCYDGTDLGYKRITSEGGQSVGADRVGTLELAPDAVPEPVVCALARGDSIYDLSELWGWNFGMLGWFIECHVESDDRRLLADDPWGSVSVEFDPSEVALPDGLTPADIALCPFQILQCDRVDYDAGTGLARAAFTDPPDYSFPTLAEHVSATVDGLPLECAIAPTGDYGTELAFSSAPPSVGHPHHDRCWPGSFEFRVANITGGLDGSYDLADPMTWSTFEISATVDDVLYGLKEGVGGGTGASGTLDYTGFPSMVGIKNFARLTDVTLVAADDPAQSISISEALLIDVD